MLAWTLLPLLAHAQQPLLSLPESTADVRVLSESGKISFPIVFSSRGPVDLRILDLSDSGGSVAGAPFSLELKPPTVGDVGALEITAVSDARLSPGEYTLDLLGQGPEEEPTRLTLRVRVPPAQLRVNPTVIEVIRPLWGEQATGPGRGVAVEELSGKRGIQALRVGPSSEALGEDGPIGGPLFAPLAPLALEAGGRAEIPLAVLPNAPLGTSAVQLELRAPELESSLLLPIELRVRRPTWLLLVAAFLGASVQLMQKVLLPEYDKRRAAERQVSALRSFIERQLEIGDDVYRRMLEEAMDLLPSRVGLLNPLAWMSRGEGLARAKVDAAVEQLNTRRQNLRAEVEALHDLLSRRYQLPAIIPEQRDEVSPNGQAAPKRRSPRAAIAGAAELEMAARDCLDRDQIDEAAGHIRAAKQAITEALDGSRIWADSVVRELNKLDVLPAKIPQPTPQALIEHHNAALKALKSDAIVGSTGVDTPGAALGALEAIHQAKRLTKPLVQEHALNLRGVAASLQVALGDNPKALEALNEHWKPFEPATDTISDIRAVHASAASLYEGVQAALRALKEQEPKPAQAGLLQEGRYAEALQHAGLPPRDDNSPVHLGESPELDGDGADPQPTDTPRALKPRATEAPTPAPAQTPRSPLVALLETAIAFAILGGLVWSSYAAQFVGTTEEMLGIFAFVYGTNLGLDQVLGQLTGRFVKEETA